FSAETRVNFKGEYYTLDDAPFAPQPVQKKLPVLIGGGGEKRTLALVAKYADNYNFFGNFIGSAEVYNHKSAVLDEHCARIGRDPKEIKRSLCLFADIEHDAAKAKGRREFLGSNLEQANRDGLLFGTPQQIVEGTRAVLEKVKVDEVIFCGLTNTVENFQEFNDEVLKPLSKVTVGA
ncbi:unnamed protein product, partial [Phaeothamnion confervicola]